LARAAHFGGGGVIMSDEDQLGSAQPYSALVDSDLREEIRSSLDQCEGFEVDRLRTVRDHSMWRGLSWIAFRDPFLLSELQNDNDLCQIVSTGHPSLKAHDPEKLLLTALKQGRLQAVRDGKELDEYYWYGKSKVDRDIWLDGAALFSIWSSDPWSPTQTMLWAITRDPQQVEDARDLKPNEPMGLIDRPRLQVTIAANELAQHCQQGLIRMFDGRSPIGLDRLGSLKIEIDDDVISVRCNGLEDAAIAFCPSGAMRAFRPQILVVDTSEQNALEAERDNVLEPNMSPRHGVSDVGPPALDEEPIGIQLSSWIIPTDEPEQSRSSVYVAWTAMRSNENWRNHGIPRRLASGERRTFKILTDDINEMIPKIKINRDILIKLGAGGVDETSVKRALGIRKYSRARQPSNPAGNQAVAPGPQKAD
jgi:hypothetical protein